MNLDPASAALFALVAICLVVTGWVVASPVLSTGERGSILAAVAAILIGIGWRIRRSA